jgi:hypothetical protein
MSELLKINVNEHTEQKNGLTYLSWAWAWAEVLKIDSKAAWAINPWPPEGKPFLALPDGSVMVSVNVTIKGDTKSSILPVMNHRNQAIKNPDAFAINTAVMRCLAKAISMHGLGLYIYAGEDLPESDEQKQDTKIKAVKITATDGIENMVSEDRRAILDDLAFEIVSAWNEGRQTVCANLYYDESNFDGNEERVYLWKQLQAESKLRSFIKANQPTKEAA